MNNKLAVIFSNAFYMLGSICLFIASFIIFGKAMAVLDLATILSSLFFMMGSVSLFCAGFLAIKSVRNVECNILVHDHPHNHRRGGGDA